MTERVYSEKPAAVKQRARRAQRVADIASGKLKFEDIPHGSNGYHNYECRCDVCRKAATETRAVTVARLRERARLHPEIIPHGTWNAYTNYRCRCPVCVAAEAERAAEKRLRTKIEQSSPEDVRDIEELKKADAYRAVVKDLKQKGRFLIIERVRPGQPGRRVANIRLEDGARKRGTWSEITTRLSEYGLTATAWTPEGAEMRSACEVIPAS